MPLHLVEKEGEKSQMKIALMLKNMETFGYKDDFRINRSYLAPSGLLCLELPKETLEQRVCLASQVSQNMNDSVAGFLLNSEIPNEINENPVSEPVSTKYSAYYISQIWLNILIICYRLKQPLIIHF